MIDLLETSNNIYLFIEYCSGGDLDKLLVKQPEKRFDEQFAIPIFK